jgi:hypothetical protein
MGVRVDLAATLYAAECPNGTDKWRSWWMLMEEFFEPVSYSIFKGRHQ